MFLTDTLPRMALMLGTAIMAVKWMAINVYTTKFVDFILNFP